MVSCFSVQRPQTTGIIQQEVTVYFDQAHGMVLLSLVAAMHSQLLILFPVCSHMFTLLYEERYGCQSSKGYQRTSISFEPLEY